MIFHLGNFKRTKLDNVFQYTDGDEVKFFDFNQLTELLTCLISLIVI